MVKKIFKAIKKEIDDHFFFIISHYPESRMGTKIREYYFRIKLKGKLGKRAFISDMVIIFNHAPITIGDDFSIKRNSTIDPDDSFGIIIGNHVHIASGVYIRAANHVYDDISKTFYVQGHKAKKVITNDGKEASIIIEDDVWIAANCVILTGTKIGKGSIIGAGVVAFGDIPEYSIMVTTPGKIIANRKTDPIKSKEYYKFSDEDWNKQCLKEKK